RLLRANRQQHDELATAPHGHVAEFSNSPASKQHRLPLLEVLAPGEASVQRIPVFHAPTHEPQRAEDEHDHRDGDEHSDSDFVAPIHDWRRGPSTPAVSASSTRIVTEEMTTARAVDLPTPSAPASVM